MSITALVEVRCDFKKNCPAKPFLGTTGRSARVKAQKDGWSQVGGKDYCKECTIERRKLGERPIR